MSEGFNSKTYETESSFTELIHFHGLSKIHLNDNFV
jgi:hypothetical protein